jgi:uncharacterized membrane protein YidH (DUF202 family)
VGIDKLTVFGMVTAVVGIFGWLKCCWQLRRLDDSNTDLKASIFESAVLWVTTCLGLGGITIEGECLSAVRDDFISSSV